MPGMRRRKRMEDGTLGPYESVFEGDLSPEEKIGMLEQENANVLYESMMKGSRIADLEAAQVQSDAIQSEILYALMNGGIL